MGKKEKSAEPPKKWLRSDGSVVACTEKVKVLEENWKEIRSLLQESLDDAVLMGCSEERVKAEFSRLVDALSSQYRDAITKE
jgi:hypothetical protein